MNRSSHILAQVYLALFSRFVCFPPDEKTTTRTKYCNVQCLVFVGGHENVCAFPTGRCFVFVLASL